MEIDTALSSTSAIYESPKLDPNGNSLSSVGVGKGTEILVLISGKSVSAVLAGCAVGEGVPNISQAPSTTT